jgi:cell division protein FtsN
VASRDYKTPRPNVSARVGSPMLVGIVIGILVGLATALAVALYLFKVPAPFMPREGAGKAQSESSSKQPEPAPGATPPDDVAAEADKPRFDFYKILPGTEEATKDRGGKRAEPKTPAPAPALSASAPVEVFFLQAGAFQSAADADNLKARLALAGIEARVLTAELPEGKVWHRVRVGPLRDVEEVARVRERLRQNQIEATLIKDKGAAN